MPNGSSIAAKAMEKRHSEPCDDVANRLLKVLEEKYGLDPTALLKELSEAK